jgi:hypothetical protein
LDIFESEASRNLDCSNVNDDSIFDRSSNILLVDRSQLVPRNVINRIFDDDIKADSGKFLKSPLKE